MEALRGTQDFWSIDYKALHKALVIYFKHHRKLSRLKNAINLRS